MAIRSGGHVQLSGEPELNADGRVGGFPDD
jgi:hypothetical protein